MANKFAFRRAHGNIVLQLRLDPPGRIVVERLDMRLGDSHVLETERTYAIGRYFDDNSSISWVHAMLLKFRIRRPVEFRHSHTASASNLEERDKPLPPKPALTWRARMLPSLERIGV